MDPSIWNILANYYMYKFYYSIYNFTVCKPACIMNKSDYIMYNPLITYNIQNPTYISEPL